jgi:5-dehydro-2-deoxygluconokinase
VSGPTYDILAMGRSSIDLYSADIGAPFPEITRFDAFVGGCPTNIAVGGRRLGLSTALLTAVGQDPVADFVLTFLSREGVDTSFVPQKPGHRTSAVLLGIEPPDRFPLVFYREGCADMQLDGNDVDAAPTGDCRMLLVTGTGLSGEPSRAATAVAMERARAAGATIVLDLDFRADQWPDTQTYQEAIGSIWPLTDLAIGTEEEIKAAALGSAADVAVSDSQISSPEVGGDLQTAMATLLDAGTLSALVVKEGAMGASVHLPDGSIHRAAPFSVDVCNVLGAGDAFASGFLYGVLEDWDWERCIRMGNATGAIVVTQPGCANFMPTRDEAFAFIDSQGGF